MIQVTKTILKTIELDVLLKNINSILGSNILESISSDNTEYFFNFKEEINLSILDNCINNYEVLNAKQVLINNIKNKYEFHKKNGWDAYQNFRAMIIIDIKKGAITEQQAFLIEHDLKIAYDRIAQNGDWKTAYFELSNVQPSYTFVQPYLTMALQFIGHYIQTNYEN